MKTLIRDVVAEVLGRLGQGASAAAAPAASPAQTAQLAVAAETGAVSGGSISARDGIGCLPGRQRGLRGGAGRLSATAEEGHRGAREGRGDRQDAWRKPTPRNGASIELEETKIGRLDHKIEKLKIIKLVPGVEWLHPDGRSGDHGITLEEYTPFGVVAAITPSTHSIPTLSGNIVNIVAAGNAVVFNAHPAAAKCAAMAVREYNKAIERETGIENLVTHHRTADAGFVQSDLQP